MLQAGSEGFKKLSKPSLHCKHHTNTGCFYQSVTAAEPGPDNLAALWA